MMAFSRNEKTHEFEAKVEVTTAKAYLINPTIGKSKWVPKSQVKSLSEPDEDGNRIFEVTDWWWKKQEEEEER
jgi:hypothetical protein